MVFARVSSWSRVLYEQPNCSSCPATINFSKWMMFEDEKTMKKSVIWIAEKLTRRVGWIRGNNSPFHFVRFIANFGMTNKQKIVQISIADEKTTFYRDKSLYVYVAETYYRKLRISFGPKRGPVTSVLLCFENGKRRYEFWNTRENEAVSASSLILLIWK